MSINLDYFNNDFLSMYNTKIKELSDNYCSRFIWSGQSEQLTSERIEYNILSHGYIVYFNDPMRGELLLPANITGYNVYNEPNSIMATGLGYTYQVNIKDCCLYVDSIQGEPFMTIMQEYAIKMTKLNTLIEEHMQQLKHPYVFGCTEETKLQAKMLFAKLKKKDVEPLFLDKTLEQTQQVGINALDLRVPYMLTDLLNDLQTLENKYNTLIGMNNANTTKRERLITDEVNSNNEIIKYNIEKELKKRQMFCDKVNKKFNTNLSVELNVQPEEVQEPKEGEKDDK